MIKKVKDLNIGSYVLSYNTETNEYEYKKISAMQNQGVRQVYLYITGSGRTLRCTDNHKVVQIDESGNFYEEQIKNVEYLLDTDLNKDYIISIEKFEECEVIDAEVEDNHNFVTADGNLVRNSRAGSQTPFSSINYGTGTTGEQRLVIKNILLATDAGLGHHETPIFPVQIFKVKDGISGNPNDPNYDLFELACKVSAKRLFPNFSFIDAPFNLQYYKEGNVDTEAAYMGCRTRVLGNHYDPTKEIVTGRGNLSFTSVNLPRLAILSEGNVELFFKKLKGMVELVFDQLLERFKVQCRKKVKNYPSLMGQGIWIDSDKLSPEDSVEEVLKHGSLTVGFIGLAECLKSLTGFHHGESEESQQLGLEIIGFMREMCDKKSEETGLNFTLIGTPAEGTCLSGDTLVQTPFGNVPIKDLKEGDLVFSYNLDSRKVEIDKIMNSGMTSASRKVMKITFDTNQEVVCTPDHLFAVRSQADNLGELIKFVPASDLAVGNRIKSNYLEYSDGGYKRFKNQNGSYIHKMVYSYYNGEIPNDCIVHHIDENKENNHIENLQLMKRRDHKIYHMKDTIGKYCYTSESQKGENNSFYGKRHSDYSKRLISESKRLNKYKGILCTEFFNGKTIEELAIMYQVSEESICRKLRQCGVSLESNHIITKIEYLNEEIPVYDLTIENNHNFFIGGDRGILVHNCGRFPKMDRKLFGTIEGVTDREYYTNSFHVPVYYNISAKDKILKEAPYHALTNGGHIAYIEVDGDPTKNVEAFEDIIQFMKKSGIGYGAINHPVDYCPNCSYTGIIDDKCPRCGNDGIHDIPLSKLKELQKIYPDIIIPLDCCQ